MFVINFLMMICVHSACFGFSCLLIAYVASDPSSMYLILYTTAIQSCVAFIREYFIQDSYRLIQYSEFMHHHMHLCH